MENIQLQRKIDNLKNDLEPIIDALILEIEELEIKNKSLEFQIDHLQMQLNDLE